MYSIFYVQTEMYIYECIYAYTEGNIYQKVCLLLLDVEYKLQIVYRIW